MKIQLVVHCFVPDSMGGTELYALRLAQHLAARGDQVSVLTYAEGDTREVVARDEEYQGIPIRRLSFDLDQTSNPILEEYDNRRVATYLKGAFAASRPDLIHVAHFGYLSASVLDTANDLGIPSVVTLTDFWPICPKDTLIRSNGSLCQGPTDVGQCVRCYAHMGPRGAPYAFLTRLVPIYAWRVMARLSGPRLARRTRWGSWLNALVRRKQVIRQRLLGAEAIFCPGAFLREILVRNGYPPERIRLSPHGIADPGRLRRATPIATGPTLRFGYVGALAEHKGAHLPVEAFASTSSELAASLTYRGALGAASPRDAYAASVLARIGETPLVSHRGPYANEAVKEVMESLDVLIVPSMCYENTPTVIYEALASGTPVIASDQGGMRGLVLEYRGGWLFPRGDAPALACLMKSLAENPETVRRVARGIRPVPGFAAHFREVSLAYTGILSREGVP